MHNPHLRQAARIILAAILALFAALLIIYVVLSMQAWRSQRSAAPGTVDIRTEQGKLALLASLAATSTPDEKTKTQILNKLPASTKQPSAADKLKLLQSLQQPI